MRHNSTELPREVENGIALINNGEYFQAHEILEFAWRNEVRLQRQLYQGLVQVSVLLYHLERENIRGAVKLLDKALVNLTPFLGELTALEVPRLVSDLKELKAQIESGHRKSVSSLTAGFRLYIHQPD